MHKTVVRGNVTESGDANGRGEWGQSGSPGMTCVDFVLKCKGKPWRAFDLGK